MYPRMSVLEGCFKEQEAFKCGFPAREKLVHPLRKRAYLFSGLGQRLSRRHAPVSLSQVTHV